MKIQKKKKMKHLEIRKRESRPFSEIASHKSTSILPKVTKERGKKSDIFPFCCHFPSFFGRTHSVRTIFSLLALTWHDSFLPAECCLYI